MKAVIMSGGKGTRLYPLTKDMPKPMVKIIDKPILEHIILLLKKHNITEIAITLGYMAESIIAYFGDGSKWNVKISYYVEDSPLGTAGSVKRTVNFVGDDFLVISGDAYCNIDITRAIAFHRAKKSNFTLIAQPKENPVGLGVLEIDENNLVTAFVEKPDNAKTSLINTGIYIINKEILSLIPQGFYDFGKQLIPRLIGEVYAYVDYGYWSDIGTLTSYYATNLKVANELAKQKEQEVAASVEL
ncbi:MAG: nucleotidyltransferase family protein [Clostridiales bacterium]|jgi:mannose-1-phosphate guanylyltransferase/phosphomannomutase|nr:nucleotidyltransferase family protein [Clostridiales bacterium]